MARPLVALTSWQKRQATLLCHFASFDYLKGLYERVHRLQYYADTILNKSRTEGRDKFLRDERWGDRGTSENWSNSAWRFLTDFGLSVIRDIADRQSQIYSITGANQCARGMAEFSLQWMTHAEEKEFDEALQAVVRYASFIDSTMNTFQRDGRWDDFGFFMAWKEHSPQFTNFPKFKICEDIIGETGKVPPKTGVYVSADYPEGSLQFAWNGDRHGKLRECSIFNRLGLKALAAVGRSKLWLDGNAMLEFVQDNSEAPELLEDSYFAKSHTPVLAPSLVARNAFTSAPSKWYYIELIEGEFEPFDNECEPDQPRTLSQRSFASGEMCKVDGFYFTPASGSRRRLKAGDFFPELNSAYGKTIWQWDVNQD